MTNARIYTLGQKSSIDIKEQLCVFNINDKLTLYKINWRELMQKICDNRLPKKIKLQTSRKKKCRMTTNKMGR